jgi:hypothetical protein
MLQTRRSAKRQILYDSELGNWGAGVRVRAPVSGREERRGSSCRRRGWAEAPGSECWRWAGRNGGAAGAGVGPEHRGQAPVSDGEQHRAACGRALLRLYLFQLFSWPFQLKS